MRNNHVAGTIRDGRKIISEETRQKKAEAGKRAAQIAAGDLPDESWKAIQARIDFVVANAQSSRGCDLFAERWISRKGYRLG